MSYFNEENTVEQTVLDVIYHINPGMFYHTISW